MVLNEEYMNDIKKVNKLLKNTDQNEIEIQKLKSYKEILVLSYGSKITEDCKHNVCYDEGYYKIKGKNIWRSDNGDCDFRVVRCQECGKSIYLVKTDYSNWDYRIENDSINVITKQYCKKK